MNYIQISEPVFKDLLSAKAKLQDIELTIATNPRMSRIALINRLREIFDKKMYEEETK